MSVTRLSILEKALSINKIIMHAFEKTEEIDQLQKFIENTKEKIKTEEALENSKKKDS